MDDTAVSARHGSWADDYRRLSAADPDTLGPEELETLADASWMVCRVEGSITARQKAYVRYLEVGADRAAARVAWRLFWDHLYGGESIVAMGWLRRSRRHLADAPEEAEHGLVALADAELALNRGSLEEAESCAGTAIAVGSRHAAHGVVALGLSLLGRVLIAGGRHDDGCASLDEAMTLVVAGRLDDYFAGAVYCALIAECRELADIRRGSEWTDAARRWCATLPEPTPFHGICRVHRGEILCLRGAWEEAELEIRAAGDELAAFKPRSGAHAFAVLGELRRRRGDLRGAEDAFRRAHRLGGDPQPGLALVRLGQGDAAAAATALRAAVVDASASPMKRAELLAALAEAALAIGDRGLATSTVDELWLLAERIDRPAVRARASAARGAVRSASGDPSAALVDLQAACRIWGELGLPYEEAQTRVLVGVAARAMGDEERATLEIESARATFDRLGASADLRRTIALLPGATRPAGLTPRQLDVMRLLAAGKSNREIAADLFISEHTVGRHVQNIFTKLGVSSRAAATAFAVEHHLV